MNNHCSSDYASRCTAYLTPILFGLFFPFFSMIGQIDSTSWLMTARVEHFFPSPYPEPRNVAASDRYCFITTIDRQIVAELSDGWVRPVAEFDHGGFMIDLATCKDSTAMARILDTIFTITPTQLRAINLDLIDSGYHDFHCAASGNRFVLVFRDTNDTAHLRLYRLTSDRPELLDDQVLLDATPQNVWFNGDVVVVVAPFEDVENLWIFDVFGNVISMTQNIFFNDLVTKLSIGSDVIAILVERLEGDTLRILQRSPTAYRA